MRRHTPGQRPFARHPGPSSITVAGLLLTAGLANLAGCEDAPGPRSPVAASSAALAAAPAPGAGTPGEGYRHPLLTSAGRLAIDGHRRARPEATAEVFLREHMSVTGVRLNSEGAAAEPLPGLVPVRRLAIAGHVPSVEPPPPGLSMGPSVRRWIDDARSRPPGLVRLSLGVRPGWNPVVSVGHQQRLAMVGGGLRTRADAAAVRAQALQRRRQAGLAAVGPLREAVLAAGGRVLAVAPGAGTLEVEIPAAGLDALVSHAGLGRVEQREELADDAGIAYTVDGTMIDGRELEDLLQTTQAYDRGYEGAAREFIAVVEGGAANVFNRHPGLDGRYDNCADLGAGSCIVVWPLIGTAHATATASVLLGDVTRGQDFLLTLSTLNPDLAERQRSGVARRSQGRGFTGSSFSFLEDRLDYYDDTFIVTQSASNSTVDPDCRGENTSSRNWNALYEGGYAVFNSTGNNGHGDPQDCTVAAPATAIGAFAVGAYQIDDDDNEVIYTMSDRGGDGTATQGRHRTIVGLVGPSGMQYAYPHYEWPVDVNGDQFRYGTEWSGGPGPSGFCCTSSSTPAVAGSAAVFRQWFKDVYNDSIDDPGILYVNLLLMGDRRRETSWWFEDAYQNVGFDSLWGAGRLRLRLFDATGLDGPMTWATGSVCVDDGFDTVVDIGAVSSDVDIINAVIWWYDRRHDDGTHHDNVDLDIDRDGGGGYSTVLSSASRDNRERVTLERPDGGDYRLKIRGQRVTADDEGCGSNSMLVYWAYVAEDGDREAAEGLGAVRPYPLNPAPLGGAIPEEVVLGR